MILQGHEDLRVVKTIEGIKSAFEELICEKDYAHGKETRQRRGQHSETL